MKQLLIIILCFTCLLTQAQVKFFMAVKPSAVATPVNDTIAINYYGNGSATYTGTNWNNWQSVTGSPTISNLKWLKDGTASTIGMSMSNMVAGNIADNGTSYCTTPTSGFPAGVYRFAWFIGSAASQVLTITGLDNAKTYDFVHLAMRSGTTITNNTMTSQGKSSIMDPSSTTCSTYGKLSGLVPSSGQITITFTTGGSYAYYNASYLIQH